MDVALKTVLFIKTNYKIVALLVACLAIIRFTKQASLASSRVKARANIVKRCGEIDEGETIFVSIASYRDPECVNTVFECFERAECPFRIHVGVCEQNAPCDTDVAEGYVRKATRDGVVNMRDNLRVHKVDASDATGPMLARSLIEQRLYKGEKYYLVIDSHTSFVQGWDQKAIEDLHAAGPRAVLTMYPTNFNSRVAPTRTTKPEPPTFLCYKGINKMSRLPEFRGQSMKTCPPKPMPTLFWGACFSFSLGTLIRDVPFDPTLPYVFIGEEISMAARMYTFGYDLFAPTSMLVNHMWSRRRPTFWEQFNGTDSKHVRRRELENQSYDQLRANMHVQDDKNKLQPSQYGFGKVRTLAQYEQYCGVNFLTHESLPRATLGVSDNPTPEEVICKYGSAPAYTLSVAQLQKKNKQQ